MSAMSSSGSSAPKGYPETDDIGVFQDIVIYGRLWVLKTLSTAEKWGFGLEREGFSNRGARTEWPL